MDISISAARETKMFFVLASVLLGLLLVVSMLVVLLLVERPIPSEVAHAARVLLSLGAGFAAAGLVGTLQFGGPVKGIAISATGGFAVFVIVYAVQPGLVGALGLS